MCVSARHSARSIDNYGGLTLSGRMGGGGRGWEAVGGGGYRIKGRVRDATNRREDPAVQSGRYCRLSCCVDSIVSHLPPSSLPPSLPPLLLLHHLPWGELPRYCLHCPSPTHPILVEGRRAGTGGGSDPPVSAGSHQRERHPTRINTTALQSIAARARIRIS